MILRGTILEPCRLQRKQTIRETLSVPLSCVSYVSGATSAQTPNPAVASPCLFMWFCLMHCHKASSIAPCDCMFVLLPSGSRKRVFTRRHYTKSAVAIWSRNFASQLVVCSASRYSKAHFFVLGGQICGSMFGFCWTLFDDGYYGKKQNLVRMAIRCSKPMTLGFSRDITDLTWESQSKRS